MLNASACAAAESFKSGQGEAVDVCCIDQAVEQGIEIGVVPVREAEGGTDALQEFAWRAAAAEVEAAALCRQDGREGKTPLRRRSDMVRSRASLYSRIRRKKEA